MLFIMGVVTFGTNWFCKSMKRNILLRVFFSGLMLHFTCSGYGQGSSKIILGPIVGELEKKQMPLNLGSTSKSLVPLIAKAISIHGGLRLTTPTESRYICSFSEVAERQVSVTVTAGTSSREIKILKADGPTMEDAALLACDKVVSFLLQIPGFFSGKICYLSDLSGKKEIFTANALMSSARPQTSYGKITFNPSWDNTGSGIFFTSNRKTFNNVYYLNLSDRKVSTIANYRGSNLRAVQNPKSSQVALILSSAASGNPEVWLSSTARSKPKRLTRNKSNESGPSWSPDGRRLMVTSDSRGKPQIYEVSLSSGVLSRIATNVSSHCTEAAWNPVDPSRFAFTAAIAGGFQICEYDFRSRKSKILTKGVRDGMQPSWANDGRHLYFTERSSSGLTRIMILDTEFEEAKPIALHNSNFGNCSQVSFHYPF